MVYVVTVIGGLAVGGIILYNTGLINIYVLLCIMNLDARQIANKYVYHPDTGYAYRLQKKKKKNV